MWPNAPHSVLRSAIEAAEALSDEVIGETHVGGATLPVPRFSVIAPNPATTGALEAMCLYAGQSVGATQEIRHAAHILQELSQGAEQRLAQIPRA